MQHNAELVLAYLRDRPPFPAAALAATPITPASTTKFLIVFTLTLPL
jgi:hypothetical protein